MTLVTIVLTLVLVGFVVWMVLQIPMPTIIRNLIIGLVSIVLIIWVLQNLGIHTGIPLIKLK